MSYFVYILRSLTNGTYYIGSTQDISQRLDRHNQGRSKYTKPGKPWELIYSEEHPNRASTTKREREIKTRKSKTYIESVVRTSRQP
jgi:putative endonuclease